MNHYVVVAETGADIPQRFVDELDLRIVPMHVQFGGESHDDGQFPASVVFDHYKKTGELPKTSGCTPADFDTAFSKIYKEDPDAKVVYLAYSSVTTCSYQSARSVSAAYPPMISLDTKQVTAGQFLQPRQHGDVQCCKTVVVAVEQFQLGNAGQVQCAQIVFVA